MDFDTIIPRTGTHSMKWDMLAPLYGLNPDKALAMWVADMDFRPPACVGAAVQRMVDHGIYGYFGDEGAYHEAIAWWMATRHGWQIAPEWVFTTHGLVNGTALCIQAFTRPGAGVVLMTPVYHAFARVIKAAGRRVVECPLAQAEGRHTLDIDTWDSMIDEGCDMLILCSPHNPGGRVWRQHELEAIADFARRHDLLVVSDEIHHDLVFPGQRHRVLDLAVPDLRERLVTMSATTKTFNIAGAHVGNVIIPDEGLRARFAGQMAALGISPNAFGMAMATAAYSPEGAEWVEALMAYLDGNRRLFDEGMNALPGVSSMPLEATYLAWVDFRGTGMTPGEIAARVEKGAQIATNHGTSFGTGGAGFLRFNLATPRARVAEAVARLATAFADLQ